MLKNKERIQIHITDFLAKPLHCFAGFIKFQKIEVNSQHFWSVNSEIINF